MASPSPPVMAPDSAEERLFDIMTSIFTFVVIGGAISKISGTVVELRGMNEAKSKQRCEIRHYLQSQDASFELVSRVMKFAEYKLEKMMPTSFDPSLISLTLQTELSVNQRSRYIKQVPIFDLTSQLWPEVFSSICVVLRKVVCENREDVFVAGGLSTALYITVTGEYSHVEGYDGQGEVTELSGTTARVLLPPNSTVERWPLVSSHVRLLGQSLCQQSCILDNDLGQQESCLQKAPFSFHDSCSCFFILSIVFMS